MTTIKEMVANDRKVRFTHYKSGELWYVTECGFSFPVPITDAGDGSFLAEDKALLFMRYIRKPIPMARSREKLSAVLGRRGVRATACTQSMFM